MELRDRLEEALRISGKSRVALAEEIGVTVASVSHWMLGKVQTIRGPTAARIEAATGVRATWLMTGQGPKLVNESQNGWNAAVGASPIPCITPSLAAAWPDEPNPYAQGNTPAWLFSTRQLSRFAFALDVEDVSMRPRLENGDQVIIDPEEELRPGAFVAASSAGQPAVLRKYRPRDINEHGVQSFDLVALHPDYPAMKSDVMPIRILGVVVELRRYHVTAD